MSTPYSQLTVDAQFDAVSYLVAASNNPPKPGTYGIGAATGNTWAPVYWGMISDRASDVAGFGWSFHSDFFQNHGQYGDDNPITQAEWNEFTTGDSSKQNPQAPTPPPNTTRQMFIEGWAYDIMHPNPNTGVAGVIEGIGETLVGGALTVLSGGAGTPLLAGGIGGIVGAATGSVKNPPMANVPQDLAQGETAFIQELQQPLIDDARAKLLRFGSFAGLATGAWFFYRREYFIAAAALAAAGGAFWYSSKLLAQAATLMPVRPPVNGKYKTYPVNVTQLPAINMTDALAAQHTQSLMRIVAALSAAGGGLALYKGHPILGAMGLAGGVGAFLYGQQVVKSPGNPQGLKVVQAQVAILNPATSSYAAQMAAKGKIEQQTELALAAARAAIDEAKNGKPVVVGTQGGHTITAG